jgi:hypothetical protein
VQTIDQRLGSFKMLLKLSGRLQLLHSLIEAKAQRAAATEAGLAGPALVYHDVHTPDDDDARAATDGRSGDEGEDEAEDEIDAETDSEDEADEDEDEDSD